MIEEQETERKVEKSSRFSVVRMEWDLFGYCWECGLHFRPFLRDFLDKLTLMRQHQGPSIKYVIKGKGDLEEMFSLKLNCVKGGGFYNHQKYCDLMKKAVHKLRDLNNRQPLRIIHKNGISSFRSFFIILQIFVSPLS